MITTGIHVRALPATSTLEDQSAPAVPNEPSRARRPDFDAGFWKIIGECSRRAPAAATEREYLRDHDKAWSARLRLVNEAKSSIVCSTYQIEPDAFGLQFVDALIAARKRGVAVMLGMDMLAQMFGNRGADKTIANQLTSKLQELRDLGGIVRKFGDADQQSRSVSSGVHAKMCVADGEHAIVGGRNVGGNYYGHLFSDFEMRVAGPIARQLQADVLCLLSRTKGSSFEDDRAAAILRAEIELTPHQNTGTPQALYHVVTWDPLHDGGELLREKNRITLALIHSVKRAKREITLTSNYVVGNKELREAVMEAARAGVVVRVITTGESASHISKMAWHGTTPGYDELVAAGVEIYETQREPDHAKLFVVDDIGAFGSYNFSDYADAKQCETLIFTGDQQDVSELRRILNESIEARCKRYDPSAKPSGSVGDRFKRFFGKLIYAIRTLGP